jgi:hypothetical protein
MDFDALGSSHRRSPPLVLLSSRLALWHDLPKEIVDAKEMTPEGGTPLGVNLDWTLGWGRGVQLCS